MANDWEEPKNRYRPSPTGPGDAWIAQKRCTACGASIPEAARICPECKTALKGLRAIVNYYSPLITFLIALITFFGLFVPIFVTYSGLADSAIDLAIIWSDKDGIHMIVRNTGSRPGIMGRLDLSGVDSTVDGCDNAYVFELKDATYQLINPKSKNTLTWPYPNVYKTIARQCPGDCKLEVQVRDYQADDFGPVPAWTGACEQVLGWHNGKLHH